MPQLDAGPAVSKEFIVVQLFPTEIPGLTNDRLLDIAGVQSERVNQLISTVGKLNPSQRSAFAQKTAEKLGKLWNPNERKEIVPKYVAEKVFQPLRENLETEIIDALRTKVLGPTDKNLSVLTAFLLAPEKGQLNSRTHLWNLMVDSLTKAAIDQGILTIEDLKKDDLFLSSVLSQMYPLLFKPDGFEGLTLVEAMLEVTEDFERDANVLTLKESGKKSVEAQRLEHTQRIAAWTKQEKERLGQPGIPTDLNELRRVIENHDKAETQDRISGNLEWFKSASEEQRQPALLAFFDPSDGLFYKLDNGSQATALLKFCVHHTEHVPEEYRELLTLAMCQSDRGLAAIAQNPTRISTDLNGTLDMTSYSLIPLRHASSEMRQFVEDYQLELIESTYQIAQLDPKGKAAHPGAQLSHIFLLSRTWGTVLR